MTTPRQSAGAPPFEDAAQDVLSSLRPRQRYAPPPQPLTEAEKAEAAKAEQAAQVCRFCIGYHPLPNTPGCPRIATFELDGDGNVKAATFFPGRKWAQGRVVFLEDLKEEDGDGER